MKDSRGFTMIEMVVVLAVIAILAAILTPIVTSYIDRARVDQATKDVKSIAAALVQFNTDTKVWPIYSSTSGFPTNIGDLTNVYVVEATPGNEAIVPSSGNGSDWTGVGPSEGQFAQVLNQNRMKLDVTGPRAWRGPYTELAPDGWGTKYYITSKWLTPGVTSNHGVTSGPQTPSAAYVISAGTNQTLETVFDQAVDSAFTVGGDDIVARIK